MAPFTTAVDWTDPATFYLGDGALAELADVAIVHRASGLRLPGHSHVLAQQSRVMRDLFLSLRGQASGRKRKPDEEGGAVVELQSPFSDFSLEEVCFLLRFVYRPSDLTGSNLDSVQQHLAGITRLANSLDTPEPLAAIDTFLAAQSARTYGKALQWVQLAEQCGLDKTWAAAVRHVAYHLIDRTHGMIPSYLDARDLSSLSRETLVAVLAAMTAAVRTAGASARSRATRNMPAANIVLAARGEPEFGSACLEWDIPQLASLRQERESPAFGPASRAGSSATAPSFKLRVRTKQPIPPNPAAGQPAIFNGGEPFGHGAHQPDTSLSVTVAATFRDDCPPGTVLAATTSVKLFSEDGVVVAKAQATVDLCPDQPKFRWSAFTLTSKLVTRLGVGKGTFKVQVDWLELQAEPGER